MTHPPTQKTIRITVQGKINLPYKELEPFQGTLKYLGKDEYERFRANVLEHGFSFVIHVWQNEGHNYIIDGHQRLTLVKQMDEIEGYEIPSLPVALVEAVSFEEAKLKVLAGTSQYGTMTKDSLLAFIDLNDLDLDEVIGKFDFPDINLKLEVSDLNIDDGSIGDVASSDESKTPSSSAGVRQLQLFFQTADYSEFLDKIEALRVGLKTENLTDTLLEIVREVYKTRFKK